jgi:hypothetical protein
MLVTLDLPDDIAQALASQGSDLSRRALEALAIDGYKDRNLTQLQVGKLLGFSRVEAEEFLARHCDLYDYDPADLLREANALKEFAERSVG